VEDAASPTARSTHTGIREEAHESPWTPDHAASPPCQKDEGIDVPPIPAVAARQDHYWEAEL
jgi:hypothetical protein